MNTSAYESEHGLTRRGILGLLGASGAALIVGCSSGSDKSHTTPPKSAPKAGSAPAGPTGAGSEATDAARSRSPEAVVASSPPP
ncbi:MAG TPA: hypothetical protein VFY10_15445, partial [Dehalococcoidia bacterium]|nr:hypothetical protein [Dehalococcoidia bacterium]